MITCAKGGPRRRDVVKVCGAGEFLSRYDRLKCYLARSHVQKHVSDWLRGTIFHVFSGGKAISSMYDLREAYLKREKESRCRLLVMSSWKKANEARRTKLSLMILHRENLKECCF